MTNDPFHEARLKVRRADHHIVELNEMLNAFLETDFYRLSVEKDVDTGNYGLQFRIVSGLPEDVPTVISEVMQPLRSALDYVMIIMVVQAGGKRSRDVQFPINETRQKVEDTIKNGQIQRLSPAIRDFILDVVQPYKGGNDAIYGLHATNNTDKHQNLMPVTSVVALTNVTGTAGGITFQDCTFAVGENRVLKIVSMPGEFEFKGYGKPVFLVSFDTGQPFEGEAVVPTLVQLSHEVSGIIDILGHMIHTQPTP